MLELWMVVVGTLVHELYAWRGHNWVVGLFTPTDESLWEHFKLGYGAILLWIPIERFILKRNGRTYWFARSTGLVALNLTVVAIFFGVRPLFHEDLTLAVDIGSYVVGSLVMGQVVRRYSDIPNAGLERLGITLSIGIAILFAVITYWRPGGGIFIEHGL